MGNLMKERLKPLFAWTAALLVIAISPVRAHASIIFSDNFDSNTGQGNISSGAVDSSTAGTFDVTLGNVDVVGPNFFPSLCQTAPELGSCIDMDGNTAGQITSTSISFAPGSYTLSFDLFGSERGVAASTTVTLGSFYSQVFNTQSSNQNIVTYNFTVNSQTSASIVFTSNDPSGDAQGTLVDNVQITSAGAVPEPASGLLMLAALPLAWIAWRRRRPAK
jgi:hypothetical protein